MTTIRRKLMAALKAETPSTASTAEVREVRGGLQVGNMTYLLKAAQMTPKAWRINLKLAEARLAEQAQTVEDARAILAYLQEKAARSE